LDKGDFVGKAALLTSKTAGLKRALVGLKLLERGIPRHGYPVFLADGSRQIGELTSGTQSPSLKSSVGIAYVPVEHSAIGTKISVEIRGTLIPAEVVATPFYKRPY
jgi:aminomethyltransferase